MFKQYKICIEKIPCVMHTEGKAQNTVIEYKVKWYKREYFLFWSLMNYQTFVDEGQANIFVEALKQQFNTKKCIKV